MEYNKALKLIEEKSYLIGKKVKGKTIDELVIYPSDDDAKKKFKEIYIATLDADKAIEPFKKFDVDVSVIIAKDKIRAGFFFSENINEVERLISEDK
ncbi:hypothetical protein [Myroides phaeus]|uniref:hypothetical protein n=1 Tax=Myroides phaeus TaxID=702745 RepID=UPI0013038B30|nr:hypothetical protein [Myroides phaeus]